MADKREPPNPGWENQKSLRFYLNSLHSLQEQLLRHGVTEEELDRLTFTPNPVWNWAEASGDTWPELYERVLAAQQAGYRDGSFDYCKTMCETLAELHGPDHPMIEKTRDFWRNLVARDRAAGPVQVAGKRHRVDSLSGSSADLAEPIKLKGDRDTATQGEGRESRKRVRELIRS